MVSEARQMTGSAAESPLDREIERIDAGETAWDAGSEEVELAVKQPLDKMMAVRLTDAQWKQIYAEASELGVGPSTLVRMWTLEKLRELRRERQTA